MSRRHGRFHHGGSESGPSPVEVVDKAECTGRSCVAVSLADCIALGCCPCAVVSMLGLALVKAPLAVSRRCMRRLRQRHGILHHKNLVRDLDPSGARPVFNKYATGSCGHGEPGEATSKGEDDAAFSPGHRLSAASDAERVWLELYQVGHWGFGRLSLSVNPPSRAGYVDTCRNADGCENDV